MSQKRHAKVLRRKARLAGKPKRLREARRLRRRAGRRAEYEALFGHTVFGSGLGTLGTGLAAGMAIEPGEKPDLGEKIRRLNLYGKAGG